MTRSLGKPFMDRPEPKAPNKQLVLKELKKFHGGHVTALTRNGYNAQNPKSVALFIRTHSLASLIEKLKKDELGSNEALSQLKKFTADPYYTGGISPEMLLAEAEGRVESQREVLMQLLAAQGLRQGVPEHVPEAADKTGEFESDGTPVEEEAVSEEEAEVS